MIDAIVVDLDGTIVDCSKRHYACYADLARNSGIPALPFDKYWEWKRARRPWREFLGAPSNPANISDFAARFVDRIEAPEYLALDGLFPGARGALLRLRGTCSRLFVVTMRRSSEGVESQLRQWGIRGQFDQVLARGTSDMPKASLAQPWLSGRTGRIAWIGDTEEDIAAAREVGALACAVCCGLRDRSLLEENKPDLVALDLAQASALIADPLPAASCYSERP